MAVDRSVLPIPLPWAAAIVPMAQTPTTSPCRVTVTLDRTPEGPREHPHLESVRVYVGEGVIDY